MTRLPPLTLLVLAFITLTYLGLPGCRKVDNEKNHGAAKTVGEAQTYVGRLDIGRARARIGLVVQDGELLAFVCSDDEWFNQSNYAWMSGAVVRDGETRLKHPEGAQLNCKVTESSVSGTFTTSGGPSANFRADAVPAEGKAGVYCVADQSGFGWILDETGFVGGMEDGTTFGSFQLERNDMSEEELRAMMALTAHKDGRALDVSFKKIYRVTSSRR